MVCGDAAGSRLNRNRRQTTSNWKSCCLGSGRSMTQPCVARWNRSSCSCWRILSTGRCAASWRCETDCLRQNHYSGCRHDRYMSRDDSHRGRWAQRHADYRRDRTTWYCPGFRCGCCFAADASDCCHCVAGSHHWSSCAAAGRRCCHCGMVRCGTIRCDSPFAQIVCRAAPGHQRRQRHSLGCGSPTVHDRVDDRRRAIGHHSGGAGAPRGRRHPVGGRPCGAHHRGRRR